MGHYVYKYVLNNEIIYIGKNDTILSERLSQHGKIGDNITEEGWNDIKNSTIYYCVLANKTMSDVVESELIRRYKPKYNKAKMSDWCGLPFVEPQWIKYTPEKTKKKYVKTESEENVEFNKKSLSLYRYITDMIANNNYTKKADELLIDFPKELECHIFNNDILKAEYSWLRLNTRSEYAHIGLPIYVIKNTKLQKCFYSLSIDFPDNYSKEIKDYLDNIETAKQEAKEDNANVKPKTNQTDQNKTLHNVQVS